MCCANSALNCKMLVAVGACAINGGLPAQRNPLDLGDLFRKVYCDRVFQNRLVWILKHKTNDKIN